MSFGLIIQHQITKNIRHDHFSWQSHQKDCACQQTCSSGPRLSVSHRVNHLSSYTEGFGDERVPEILRMAGRPSNRFSSKILQVQYGLWGKLGCEDGIRRDYTFSDFKDSHLARTLNSCSLGRNARRSAIPVLRKKGHGFRCSKCVRQSGMEAPELGGRVAKFSVRTTDEKWKTQTWGLPFSGQHNIEHVLRGLTLTGHFATTENGSYAW